MLIVDFWGSGGLPPGGGTCTALALLPKSCTLGSLNTWYDRTCVYPPDTGVGCWVLGPRSGLGVGCWARPGGRVLGVGAGPQHPCPGQTPPPERSSLNIQQRRRQATERSLRARKGACPCGRANKRWQVGKIDGTTQGALPLCARMRAISTPCPIMHARAALRRRSLVVAPRPFALARRRHTVRPRA